MTTDIFEDGITARFEREVVNRITWDAYYVIGDERYRVGRYVYSVLLPASIEIGPGKPCDVLVPPKIKEQVAAWNEAVRACRWYMAQATTPDEMVIRIAEIIQEAKHRCFDDAPGRPLRRSVFQPQQAIRMEER